MKNNTFLKQIRDNSVALISLFIAISSLSYNTWRNEKTESNRNQRHAAFEIIVVLNELQQVVFHHYYDKDISDKGNPRTGWTHVLTIDDLSNLLGNPVLQASNNLHQTWNDNWNKLETEQKSVDAVLKGIEMVRSKTLTVLKMLD